MFFLLFVIVVMSFLGFWLFKNKSYGSLALVVLVGFFGFQGVKLYWTFDAVQPVKVASLQVH